MTITERQTQSIVALKAELSLARAKLKSNHDTRAALEDNARHTTARIYQLRAIPGVDE